jgi:hypothetical protein
MAASRACPMNCHPDYAMPTDDPIIRVITSEFDMFEGRSQHRPTYDTGRKAHDGTGVDAEPRRRRPDKLGQPTNTLLAEWTTDGVVVTFEDLP